VLKYLYQNEIISNVTKL